MNLPDPALIRMFADGAVIIRNDGRPAEPARVIDAGPLVLPTGRIVVADPFLNPWNDSFSARVPPGTYPVLLSIVREDVAAVMVGFAMERSPVHWRPAKPAYFNVDSAMGCVMDEKVCRFLRRKAQANRYDRFDRRFRDALSESDGVWANCCVDSISSANIVLFGTWGGDGSFPSFFGYDEDGNVACLVTDMYLSADWISRVEVP
jgi:hypothetical protein